MKLSNPIAKIVTLSLIASIGLVSSCKEDEERLTASDSQDISEEAITDSYFQDADDIGGVAIGSPSADQYNGGRTSGTITISDDRCHCAIVTLESNGTIEAPQGIITVDFGAGCIDARLNVRKGKLKFAYNGKRFQPESTVVMTTDNYSINDIKLEGTRTLTNVQGSTDDAPKFNVVLANGKAIFQDGSFAVRESDITLEWIRAANPSNDYLLIDQASTASGTTRGGRSYSVSLSEGLKYKRFCGLAVEGVKKYIIDEEKEIVIDYGNGECDNAVTITVNGVTHNINVN
ncbi:MAG TPA: hypothetical protein VEW65_11995 [Chryseolinea sp.]|nr:hypothetical protein [Chryseolinea sp.]